jgi:hypothetical protein
MGLQRQKRLSIGIKTILTIFYASACNNWLQKRRVGLFKERQPSAPPRVAF